MRSIFVSGENGVRSTYVYYFDQESGAAQTANLVTREEAEDLAANIAKLPELLKAPQH
jgi:hypothetical protein